MGEAVDWRGLMRVAHRALGLEPTSFWALTPAEFLALAGPETGPASLGREGLAALMARFPDPTHKDDKA
ncbi:MAG: phage tail assembly chaperone [Rubricella sp.]